MDEHNDTVTVDVNADGADRFVATNSDGDTLELTWGPLDEGFMFRVPLDAIDAQENDLELCGYLCPLGDDALRQLAAFIAGRAYRG